MSPVLGHLCLYQSHVHSSIPFVTWSLLSLQGKGRVQRAFQLPRPSRSLTACAGGLVLISTRKVGMVGWWLDYMILEVFLNLNDSMIPWNTTSTHLPTLFPPTDAFLPPPHPLAVKTSVYYILKASAWSTVVNTSHQGPAALWKLSERRQGNILLGVQALGEDRHCGWLSISSAVCKEHGFMSIPWSQRVTAEPGAETHLLNLSIVPFQKEIFAFTIFNKTASFITTCFVGQLSLLILFLHVSN